MSSKTYYRSLSELEQSPEFEQFLHREFPQAASEFPRGVSRRRWLQLMGASLAFSGLAGCRLEEETISPFATRPANRIPGEAKYFNTTVEIAGQAQALRATSYDGRPIKLDGNPDSPLGGGSSAFVQAAILELYDPDRGTSPRELAGKKSYERSWDEVDHLLLDELKAKWAANGGAGLFVLAEPTVSPTALRLQQRLAEQLPQMRWFEYAPVSRENERRGAVMAFGRPYAAQYDLESARVVLAVDADLLGDLRNARGFARSRDPKHGEMSRLYAVECELSTTGGAADHRIALQSRQVLSFLQGLEEALEQDDSPHEPAAEASYADKVFAALLDDLKSHRGTSVIAVGPRQPAEVHAIAHRLNHRLGNIGSTVQLVLEPSRDEDVGGLEQLVAGIDAGQCETLLILGGNPSYDAPADVPFAKSLAKVARQIHLAVYPNETSAACQWYLPMSHALECWSDTRLADGTYGVGQPLIAPLHQSRSLVQFLGGLVSEEGDALALVQRTARQLYPALSGPKPWNRLVHDGFLADSAAAGERPELKPFEVAAAAMPWRDDQAVDNGRLELVFSTASSVFDGRFANNAWLQEAPHPLTKQTWGNAAIMSPKTADALGVRDHDVVRLEANHARVEIPVYVMPGQATGSVAVALGYGRTHAGLVGGSVPNDVSPVGVDVNPLRTSEARYFRSDLRVVPTGRQEKLATTQDHFAIDQVGLQAINDRVGDLVREGTLDEYKHHADFAQHRVHHPPLESPWTEVSYDGHAWGMSIDLNKCVGCNACMVACQAENNVPVVGPEQVRMNREMHWIRVDRYFAGDPEQPEVVTQPVACHHCENAPCEQVCPVAATVHSDEGLNDMAYNRCIGTRYCGNNCPYKVRRFNFLDYRREQPAANRDLMDLVLNPEVTVRSRGVMEKCTYCVQRIQNGKIHAKNERRPLGPNEIVAACQQACPSEAITFGDLNNPASDVAKAHADPRAYAMLAELNIKPRTRYLARIRNPHPWLSPATSAEHGHGDAHHAESATEEAAG